MLKNTQMYTQEEFLILLTHICEKLPKEFFDELHLGVILDPRLKYSPYAINDELIILGEYHTGYDGNKITIFYGSFEKYCETRCITKKQLIKKLEEVVKHEFRHHLENRANIHDKTSLEYEDYLQIQEYLRLRKKKEIEKNRLYG